MNVKSAERPLPKLKTIEESIMEFSQHQGYSDRSSEVMNWDNTLHWIHNSEYPGWTYYKFPKVMMNCSSIVKCGYGPIFVKQSHSRQTSEMFCFSTTPAMRRTGWPETLKPCPTKLTIEETWMTGNAREASKTQPPLETWAVLFLWC